MDSPVTEETIFVRLLDEGIDVWRPAVAVCLGPSTYRIAPQSYAEDVESWEFSPGDVVECRTLDLSEGRVTAAVARVGGP